MKTKRTKTRRKTLRFTQALSETLPTKVNKTRGREDMRAKICKRCQMNQVEDDGHILSSCTFNKDLITKRHDYVVRKMAKEFMKRHLNAKIWKERSWRSGTELLQPEITMADGEEVNIIEITLPNDRSKEYLA